MLQRLHEEHQENKKFLSEEEVMQIREGLKRKWN